MHFHYFFKACSFKCLLIEFLSLFLVFISFALSSSMLFANLFFFFFKYLKYACTMLLLTSLYVLCTPPKKKKKLYAQF